MTSMRFFRSVVDPVMRDNAPSDESIPDIVKRQKLYEGQFARPSFSRAAEGAGKEPPSNQNKRDK